MNRLLLPVVVVLVLVTAALSSLFTVQQTEQVLITQFGEPRRVIREPGLHAKLPFIQSVIAFDRRLLDFQLPGEEIILSDQRRLIVDSFTRYHVTDPLLYYQTTGTGEAAIRGRLSSLVSSALRRVLGGEPLLNVLSRDRLRIMNEIRRQVNEEATRFGIAVDDVRIRRADLPEENTQAVLSRMQSERERVAREARAEGAEQGARIRADADRQRTVLIAEAQAQSDILRGQAEQEASLLFSQAYQRDPAFYQFWRSMQAYREAFGEGDARLVLSPDSDFFRYFRESPARPLTPQATPADPAPPLPAPPVPSTSGALPPPAVPVPASPPPATP
jgi:membrane protease subunit HflC